MLQFIICLSDYKYTSQSKLHLIVQSLSLTNACNQKGGDVDNKREARHLKGENLKVVLSSFQL